MKSQALQELIQKIFSDEQTKLRFLSNPDSILSRSDLTEQEKKAVMRTHTKLGLVTSDSNELALAIKPTVDWHAPAP